MTEQMPPNPPGFPLNQPLDYGAPRGRTGLATTSMVLGIVGVVTACFGVGVLVGIAALILGIVALTRINNDPRRYGGKGMAITGIVTGSMSVVAVPLLIAILLPSLGKARELANRSYCAANMRGIVQSMVVYSNDNMDAFPLVEPPERPGAYRLATDGLGGNTGAGGYATTADALKSYYGTAAGMRYDSGSVPANLWMLVLNGQCSPKQFICKSDPVATNVSQLQTAGGTSYYINFNGSNPDYGYSYSTAYPWAQTQEKTSAPGPWWKNTTDSSLPIMSDMAPANSSGSRPVASTPGTAGGGLPAAGNKAWNSPNHQRAGQEVAFADAHTEWCNRPDVGQSSDNIFTSWNGCGASSFNEGTPVTGGSAIGVGIATPGALPATGAPFDIVMVPVSDVGTGARR